MADPAGRSPRPRRRRGRSARRARRARAGRRAARAAAPSWRASPPPGRSGRALSRRPALSTPGRPVAGSSRWCAKRPSRVPPDAHVQARGRDAAGGDSQRADRLAGEGVLDLDLIGLELRADAADREVPAAVDHEARVAGEPVRDCVRAQPLAGAAGVDRDARRSSHGAARDRRRISAASSCSGCGRAGPARRRRGERLLERCRRAAVERGRVAGALERARERRVDQPIAALARPRSRRALPCAAAARRGRVRGITVQRAQLAVRRESATGVPRSPRRTRARARLPRRRGRASRSSGGPISRRTSLPIEWNVMSCSRS